MVLTALPLLCDVVLTHWCLTEERRVFLLLFKRQGCWEENKFHFKYAVYERSAEELGGAGYEAKGYMGLELRGQV